MSSPFLSCAARAASRDFVVVSVTCLPGRRCRSTFSSRGIGSAGSSSSVETSLVKHADSRQWYEVFHGLTLGSLSLNGNAEFRDGFGPLLAGCDPVPFGDLEALSRELDRGDVAALVLEPIQGKGVNLPPHHEEQLAVVAGERLDRVDCVRRSGTVDLEA